MHRTRERGIATVEFALFLPILLSMILLCVEGGNMLRAYTTLQEASREGARNVLSNNGSAARVTDIVRNVAKSLSGSPPNANVTFDTSKKTVTVEVEYAYQGIFGASLSGSGQSALPVLHAKTTMPVR